MPRTLEEPIKALGHCPHPLCEGHSQRPVDAIRRTVEYTYVDAGGDMPGVERSNVYIVSDEKCDCGRKLEVTEQTRVNYMPLSGHDANGLLKYKPPEQIAV